MFRFISIAYEAQFGPRSHFGQLYTAERPFQPKLGFCTGLTKPAIATRVLYEILSFFLWIIGTLWVIDSTSKEFWLLYKILIFGPEKQKRGISKIRRVIPDLTGLAC